MRWPYRLARLGQMYFCSARPYLNIRRAHAHLRRELRPPDVNGKVLGHRLAPFELVEDCSPTEPERLLGS
jgi:hypothetical protein